MSGTMNLYSRKRSTRFEDRLFPFAIARFWAVIASILLSINALGHVRAQENTKETLPRLIPSKSIKNLIQVTADVYSGGVPEGEKAFQELSKLGIKTILSVDGMKPNVALAEAVGLRYIHLPHGYDGIREDRRLDLAKAILESPKPIFIHCHHGKHRSPAATASSCITLGWLNTEQGKELLQFAGTNPNYRGLYRAVEEAKPVEVATLRERNVRFQSVTELPPLIETMVSMDELFEKLGAHGDDDSTPTDANKKGNQALLLAEHYTELIRTSEPDRLEAGYLKLLREGETLAKELERELRGSSPEAASKWLERLKVNCSDCHKRYRDNVVK